MKTTALIPMFVTLMTTPVWFLAPNGGQAQQSSSAQQSTEESSPALLVADEIYITQAQTLVARGNVEAFQNGQRIQATRVEYNEKTGELRIEGPIRIEDELGDVVILADDAELDGQLANGLLTGAKVIYAQQLQLTTLRMARTDGRYTELFKAAVTSCKVCDDDTPPLWQVRARKVTHDNVEKQIYLEDAQFRIGDIPVFYMPRLRVPDPSLSRYRGFLPPTISSSSELGTGIRIPYFVPLGDHRDITLEPYLSPKTTTLNYRYRQAFVDGDMEFEGAVSSDELGNSGLRGYLFGEGEFKLSNDWDIDFELQLVTDDAYLLDYDISDTDRLKSELGLEKINRDQAMRFSAVAYDSLRTSIFPLRDPDVFANARYNQRYFPALIGGEIALTAQGNAYATNETTNILGRDVARANADAVWFDHWISPSGLRHDVQAGVGADMFSIRQDSRYDPVETRITPRAAYKASFPMRRAEQKGGYQVLEPVVQLGWAHANNNDIPNDESRFVEFDQGDILSLSRFPAPDVRESATTLVYGVNWARYPASGLESWLTAAQVLRSNSDDRFSPTSGLSGTRSDLLLAGQLRWKDNYVFGARTLLNSDFDFTKTEFRGAYDKENLQFEAVYSYLDEDPSENRFEQISEIWFDGGYRFADNWRATTEARYSFQDSTPRDAGMHLIYEIECLELDFSLRRRYTSNVNANASTSIGLSVRLTGFSAPGNTIQASTCKQ